MAKEYVFQWQIAVPKTLADGAPFDRWDEDLGMMIDNGFLQIDEDGFYIYWLVDGKEAQVYDLTQISEARQGPLPKDPKLLFDLEQRGGASKESLEERSIMVVYGQDFVNTTNWHFVAQDVSTAKAWLEGLQTVLHRFRIYHICPMMCLRKHWKMLCLSVNERRKIPVRSITRTFASGKTEKMVMQCLVELGLCLGGKNEEIEPSDFTFDKFYELYLKICPRTELQDIFLQLSNGNDYLTMDQLVIFLNEKQRDPRLNEILFPFYDRIRVQQLFKKYEPNEEFKKDDRMSVDGFLRMLMSDDNAPVFLSRIELYQDMDQPLCHYYINSSHNTYLVGRQFGGRSSVDIYRQVLLSGCRCIELDCWNGTGDDKSEPIITHGKAMCTDVLFKDVIVAIKETAFITSEFPVILSFENHCSKANQLKMARYCMEIFGDMLLSRAVENYVLEPGAVLPSPSSLKRKILIKNKRLKPDVERRQLEQFLKEGRLDDEGADDTGETPTIVAGEDCPLEVEMMIADDEDAQFVTTPTGSLVISGGGGGSGRARTRSRSISITAPLNQTSNSGARHNSSRRADTPRGEPPSMVLAGDEAHPELKAMQSSSEVFTFKGKLKSLAQLNKPKEPQLSQEEEERLLAMYHYTGATTTIHPLLSSLVNYTHPVKFQSFDLAEQNNCHFHMSSFSESTGLGYLKQSAIEFVNYNKRQLSRIYPKGGRVDSSNFLPQIFWNAGVQMVALNFQTPDLPMQLNQGKFEYNGSCGYLLKPDFMRRPDRMFDPFSESPVDGVIAAYCSVQVISGQFLSDRKIGTCVEVEMYGLPTDTIRKEFRTRIVPANGLNPVYNEEPFVFRKVVLPELAVLRIAVYDENNKLLGQRILPLDGLQAGYRHISLRTETNLPMTLPTVFCNIVLKTYIPEGLGDLVEALTDPKGFRADLEKRQKQMEAMGIKREDIGEVLPAQRKQGSKGSSGGLSTANSVQVSTTGGSAQQNSQAASQASAGAREEKERQETKMAQLVEAIKVDELRKDKSYVKLLKKHQKDVDELRKRHAKERTLIQKQQCSAVEKLVADKDKDKNSLKPGSVAFAQRRSSNGSVPGNRASAAAGTNSHRPVSPCASDTPEESDDRLRTLIVQQTYDYSGLTRRQREEEHRLIRAQMEAEWELLEKLLDEAHKRQFSQLKHQLEIEFKELREQQSKKSCDDSRSIQQDKGIKTKAEKDRRIKEVQEKNLKIFVEERKRLALKHQRHHDQMSKIHVEQKEQLKKEAKRALELEDQDHLEALLATKSETVV